MTFRFSPRWQQLQGLLGENPDRFYATLEDRERQIETYLDYGEEAFTTTLTATTTNPNVGATGYVFSMMGVQGVMVDFWGEISFAGAGVAAGSGTYRIDLPFPARLYTSSTGANVARTLGWIQLVDSGTLTYAGVLLANSAIGADFGFFQVAAAAATVNNTNPWGAGPAAGDAIRWGARYVLQE